MDQAEYAFEVDEDGIAVLRSPWDPALRRAIRAIPGRFWAADLPGAAVVGVTARAANPAGAWAGPNGRGPARGRAPGAAALPGRGPHSPRRGQGPATAQQLARLGVAHDPRRPAVLRLRDAWRHPAA